LKKYSPSFERYCFVLCPKLSSIETVLLMMAHQRDLGPLSLQMGDVTGAVDDLVHGYENLVHALPNLSNQVKNVHADTEQMAKQLEVFASFVVYIYSFL
jgi:hypothetical protein